MSVTRLEVLERLATVSDAAGRKTTTVEALASGLDTDERTVQTHLDGLAACELARFYGERVRVTITGEELLALDVNEVIIVDPSRRDRGE
jgi:DNA-binding transcriptional ArsR family regulator